MLEKIKAFAETVKSVLLYLVAPISIIGGFIYYLITQNHTLQDKLSQSKAEAELAKTLSDKQEAEHDAKQAVDQYTSLRDEYLSDKSRKGSGDV